MPQLVQVVPKTGGFWTTGALRAVRSTTTRRPISNVFDAIPHVKAAMVTPLLRLKFWLKTNYILYRY